jgi:acetyltransferase
MNQQQTETLTALRPNGGIRGSALSEHNSKQLINAWGVPITQEILAATSAEAVDAAQTIGYPVVLKVDSPDILHKTEAGVVRLGLQNAEQVAAAYDEIISNAKTQAPKSAINGVLVQELVSGGTEVIVGVSYDDQLGPVLLFGTGGIMVEVYNDVALRLCPITPEEAGEMISQVKGAKLLQGFRGSPKGDVKALAAALVQVSQLAVNLEGQLSELDINPLIVLPEGQGVKAVDALALF